MKLEDFKIGELYLVRSKDYTTIEKIIRINKKTIRTACIKTINSQVKNDIKDVTWSKKQLKMFRPLTNLEKIKYL